MKTVIEILNDIENKWNNRETWTDFLEWCRNWWIYALREAKEWIQKETWWISVEDRLPEEFIEVLTYWPNWMCVDDYENPNNRTYRNWFHRMSDTTHWMPLPLPPNE